MPKRTWSEDDDASLIRQVVVEKKDLSQIRVVGKTSNAINGHRQRLRELGLLGDACPVRVTKTWTINEVRLLRYFIRDLGYSAAKIVDEQLLPPHDSVNAIRQVIRRFKFANPKRSTASKNAKKLDPKKTSAFHEFLLNGGKSLSSEKIAELWGVSKGAVREHRNALGIQVSWQEARSNDEYTKNMQEGKRRMREQSPERRRKRREALREKFVAKARELERESFVPRRVCDICRGRWFEHDFFYHGQQKKGSSLSKVFYRRVCKICVAEQKDPAVQNTKIK